MDDKYILGIDAGTSIIKAILFDLNGNELCKDSVDTCLSSPNPSWIEIDMNSLWDNVKKCLKKIIRKSKVDTKKILGIGLTGPGDGTWMIDEKGNPVRPGIYWCDGRSGNILNEWLLNGTLEKAFEICGTAVNTGCQCVQLNWLNKNEPEIMKKVKTIFHCKDWLFFKFTGERSSDQSDESIAFFNIDKRQYDERLFKLFGIEKYMEKYPVAKFSQENTGTILEKIAKEFNLKDDLIVSSGPMDVVACALGGGSIYHGQACSIIGTASIHELITDFPMTSPKMIGITLCHAHKNRWIRLMASMSATPNLDWFIKELGYKYSIEAKNKDTEILKYVDSMIEDVPLGCDGILYHPYIFPGGERAPFNSPNARANFSGLTIHHSLNFLLRSIYEGVGFSMLDCYKNMPVDVNEIILTGGGARSNIWCQILADITGKTIKIPVGEELGAKGAALNLGVATGIYNSFEEAILKTVSIKKSYYPNSGNTKKYNEIYKIYKMTYEKMIDVWNERKRIYREEIS